VEVTWETWSGSERWKVERRCDMKLEWETHGRQGIRGDRKGGDVMGGEMSEWRRGVGRRERAVSRGK
jgi:hypothetical protein